MKTGVLSSFAAVMAVFAGCAKTDFCAVSVSGREDGGIYHFQGEKVFHTSVPRSNYMIKLPGKGAYCVTQNGKRGQSGNILLVRTFGGRAAQIVRTIPVKGITPCHAAIAPDGKYIYTANYSSGTISEIPLPGKNPGTALPVRLIAHQGGSKVNRRRQSAPHPHFVGFNPVRRELFVCDLGMDRVMIYPYGETGIREPAAESLELPPGSGPRHLAFSPCGNRIFVANELNSTVTAFVLKNGKWQRGKTLSTRKCGAAAAKNFPGAVKIAGDGRFFLVTNRGDDDIAIFAVLPNGDFKWCRNVPAQGGYPSDLMVDDARQQLRVINLKGGNIATFAIKYRVEDMELRLLKKAKISRGIGLCD